MLRNFSAIFLSLVLIAASAYADEPWQQVVGKYCLDCHDADSTKGDLDLEAILDQDIGAHSDTWEKVIRQLDARQMPPLDKDRPDLPTYDASSAALVKQLDAAAAENPNPGRTETLRRLTRTEYQNAIRDLLALEIDAAELLPADESSHGFDNTTVGDLSPTLLDRYLSAAQKISRLAVGTPLSQPDGRTIRIAPDLTQEHHVEGLPLGTRGGAVIRHTFPQSGGYEIQIRLTRDRNEKIEGLQGKHDLEILLNNERAARLTVKPPENPMDHSKADNHLKVRIAVDAGPQDLGITFVDRGRVISETFRQPYQSRFNFHRHPRKAPAIYQVTITGPLDAPGASAISKAADDTPSRQRIFTTRPASLAEEANVARKILASLMRRAWRRPISDDDLARPMQFFAQGREASGSFDAGIETALSAILVSREFLFRVERQPKAIAASTPYPISDLDLASRLSFFLWSGIPDEELLKIAGHGELSDPGQLEKQARRMLNDARSHSLVSNFADQWLYLRNLASITPDARLFPDFDDNLRQAFRRETEMLFETVLREDRSVLGLLRTDETFLNERLAKHYGIPHIYGTRFRRVPLGDDHHRGGLLRHGSILTVTSYATRTSPVIRGNWILENLLGSAPPPPPANVPALEDNDVAADLPFRERFAEHRKNPACASCHLVIDPVGFPLENFDAVGRWRSFFEGHAVDSRGGFPDGSEFANIDDLEDALLAHPELFVRTLTEKLLTYALGRGIEPSDAPAVRKIVRGAEADNYRFSKIITGIVTSVPFTQRTSAENDE